MRITHKMLTQTTLRNLNVNTERMEKLQERLTSGRRITAPSDDPIGAATAIEFRATLGELEQFIQNADSARSWLEASDSAMGTAIQALQRARELAVQGANDALGVTDRQSITREVSQLIDHLIGIGNSSYAGQYIFAGYRVNSAPFAWNATNTAVIYSGDSGNIGRKVDTNSTVLVNVPGDTAFSQAFAALVSLRDDLATGSTAAVSARLGDIDGAIDTVLASRTEIGARVNRIEAQSERLESLRVNIAGLLSKVQDVDMTETITEFSVQQAVYQAALAAGAKAVQPSLLDYLR